MKTLVLFYSYSGNSKRLANELAAKESADIAEIKDVKRPGTLKAYSVGCFAAMRGKAWPIQPLSADLSDYERLILFAPIWAGNPAPAFNAVLELLPAGKPVEVKLVSGSGESNCEERLKGIITNKGCSLDGFENIKA